MTLRDVAARLVEVGRPLPHTSVSDIENGSRRVDVDDLTALAIVLGVSPITLLMPSADDSDAEVTCTGIASAPAQMLWEWLRALGPFDSRGDAAAERAFLSRAQPDWDAVKPLLASVQQSALDRREEFRQIAREEFLRMQADGND